jgi:hypothetical protein
VIPAPSCTERRSLDLRLLAAAPELASLAVLDHVLGVCAASLLAQHPTLCHALRPDPEPPSLREARRLLAAAQRFQTAITRYRSAVLDALLPDTDDDHLPF